MGKGELYATSMAHSCCSLNYQMVVFLQYRLRKGFNFLFWMTRNCLTRQVAVISALSVSARDRLLDRLFKFSSALLQYPATNEGMMTRDKLERELQTHLESSEFSSEVASQVAAYAVRALEFLSTSSRDFFFKHVHLFHDFRQSDLPEAWRQLAGCGCGGQGAGGAGLCCGRDGNCNIFPNRNSLCDSPLIAAVIASFS